MTVLSTVTTSVIVLAAPPPSVVVIVCVLRKVVLYTVSTRVRGGNVSDTVTMGATVRVPAAGPLITTVEPPRYEVSVSTEVAVTSTLIGTVTVAGSAVVTIEAVTDSWVTVESAGAVAKNSEVRLDVLKGAVEATHRCSDWRHCRPERPQAQTQTSSTSWSRAQHRGLPRERSEPASVVSSCIVTCRTKLTATRSASTSPAIPAQVKYHGVLTLLPLVLRPVRPVVVGGGTPLNRGPARVPPPVLLGAVDACGPAGPAGAELGSASYVPGGCGRETLDQVFPGLGQWAREAN